jgi:hypothetical protein
MKKISTLGILILFICFISCKKNNSTSSAYTPDCSGTTPTFAANVEPIILSACATSGCHNSGSNQGPGALTTYSQIKSSISSIRSSVVSGRMPQGTSLSTAQKNSIVCWIDAGAANN